MDGGRLGDKGRSFLVTVGVERIVRASAVLYTDILLIDLTDMLRVDTSQRRVLFVGGVIVPSSLSSCTLESSMMLVDSCGNPINDFSPILGLLLLVETSVGLKSPDTERPPAFFFRKGVKMLLLPLVSLLGVCSRCSINVAWL